LFVPNGPDSGIVHLQLLGFWYLSIHHLVKHKELDLFCLWYNGAESTTRILILVLEEGTQIIHFVEVVKFFFFYLFIDDKRKNKNSFNFWYWLSVYLQKSRYVRRLAQSLAPMVPTELLFNKNSIWGQSSVF